MTYILSTDEATTYAEFTEAREAAEAQTASDNVEVQVVHQESSIVAFLTTPVPAGQHFTPWTRVELPKHPAPRIEGFIPAYTRKRILSTAYRGTAVGAGWAIHDGRTGNVVYTRNTKETAHVFTEMRLGRMI